MKKTPWYPGTVKPVRVGWYETKHTSCGSRVYRDRWDGEHFRDGLGYRVAWQGGERYFHWRGLTEKAK